MNTADLIHSVYAAFNQRRADDVLAFMSDTVSWPKASEGGRVTGKEEIRSYWTRQWKEFDPHVDPLEIRTDEEGRVHVKVHQLVKDLAGNLLSDSEVWHVYTMSNGLIERMDLGSGDGDSASAAFTRR